MTHDDDPPSSRSLPPAEPCVGDEDTTDRNADATATNRNPNEGDVTDELEDDATARTETSPETDRPGRWIAVLRLVRAALLVIVAVARLIRTL